MCGLCGRTGAPTKRGPPHEDKRNFFLLLLICCNMPTCRKIIELLNKKRISCCAATPPIVQRCCGACGECWLTYGESRHCLLPTSTQQWKGDLWHGMACHWLHYIILNTTKCYRLADLQSLHTFLVIKLKLFSYLVMPFSYCYSYSYFHFFLVIAIVN